jgi:hypothetical protein
VNTDNNLASEHARGFCTGERASKEVCIAESWCSSGSTFLVGNLGGGAAAAAARKLLFARIWTIN